MPSPHRDTERILPCLLERLTDHYPRARRESREHRTVSLRKYRENVVRDLEWLLNCESHPMASEFEGYGRVQESVVNFGVRSLIGAWLSSHEPAAVERLVREALLRFEPRLVPEALRVRVMAAEGEAQPSQNMLSLEIAGELWAAPIPEPLYVRTELDLETGSCAIRAG